MREETTTQTVDVPDDVDTELLAKVLANPEMKVMMAFIFLSLSCIMLGKINRHWYAHVPNLKEIDRMLIDKRTKNIIDNI